MKQQDWLEQTLQKHLKSALQTFNNALKHAGILNKIEKGRCQRLTLTYSCIIRQSVLKQKQKSIERLFPFVTTYYPVVQDLIKRN